MEVNCDWCKKEIEIYPSELRNQKHYCNPNCQMEHQRNGGHWALGQTKETNESIRRTSEKLKGHKKFGNRIAKGHLRKDGRKQISIKGKNYYECRLIMEKHLGRYLKPTEVIHHKDGNPTNNDITNLELLSSQSEHTKLHHREGSFKQHLEKLHNIELIRGDNGRWLNQQKIENV